MKDIVLLENKDEPDEYKYYKDDFIEFVDEQLNKYESIVKIQKWYLKRLYKPTSPYILRMVEDWQNE